MRSIVLLLSCLLVAVYAVSPETTEKIKQKILKLGTECKSEIGATDDDVAPLFEHNPPTTDKGKCVLACVNKKFGMLDSDGKISKDGTYAALEKYKDEDSDLYGKMKKVADTCLDEVSDESDECETALNLYICTKREREAVGIKAIDFSSQ